MPRTRTDSTRMSDAGPRKTGAEQDSKNDDPSENAGDSGTARDMPARAGGTGGHGGQPADDSTKRGAGGAGAAGERGQPADVAGGARASPAPAADGGTSGAPAGKSPPVAGASSDPPAQPQAPPIGRSLLFWGDAPVTYPFSGNALIRSERLPPASYRLTGKLTLRNPSETALDVTCTVQMNQAINLERISLPAADESGAGGVSLLLMCVGATGVSADQQRASLSCTCASGAACNGLSFESLGIIAKVVAADSGPVQVMAPASN